MTQVYEIGKESELFLGEQEAEQFVDHVAVLLGITGDYASAWEIANEVCDRYGVGIAA